MIDLFEIKFLVSEEGALEAKLHMNKESMNMFNEAMNTDLEKIFRNDRFNNGVTDIIETVVEEVNKGR